MEIQSSTFTSKVVSEDDFDYSLIKVFSFLALNFITLFLGFYCFKIFLEELNVYYFRLSFILFSLFFIFSLLDVLLIKSVKKIFWFSFFSAIFSMGVFLENFQNILFVGGFIFFIFLFFSFKLGNEFLKNSLRIKFFELADLFFKKLFFGFLLFLFLIFFVYYFNLNNFQFNEEINNFFIKKIINLIKPILPIYFNTDNENVLLKDLFRNLALKEINKSIPDFKDYLPQIKEKILTEAIKKYQSNLEEKFKIKLDLDKGLKDNIENNILVYLRKLDAKSRFYFALGFVFILYGIFNIIFKFLAYFYAFLTFLIYKFLIVIGFIHVSLETRSREFVIMK